MNCKLAVLMALALAGAPALACYCNCDTVLPPMESGDYLIVAPPSGRVHAGDEWLVGAGIHVDRDAEIATIRYTREGTTYEARFMLEQPQ